MRSLALVAALIPVGPGVAADPETHWSLRPRARPAVPEVHDPRAAARTPVDAFILARLAKEGLSPAPEADRATLIRRVTFDLTGLPPTPAEVEAFLKDDSPEAYAKLVDRLLDSPAYGEMQARHWLDVARYAEDQAHTFAVKPYSEAWKYRDWVIRAFNEDLPFDRFVKYQIAADLYVGDTPAELRHRAQLTVSPRNPRVSVSTRSSSSSASALALSEFL